MTKKEAALVQALERCFRKRHNGLWFRSVVPVLIRDLRGIRAEPKS